MQNRTAIWVFTVLLTLVCLYQISFTFVTSSVEAKAEKTAKVKLDSLKEAVAAEGAEIAIVYGDTLPFKTEKDFENVLNIYEQKILDAKSKESVYPLLGYSYGFCKKNELNLGLDLQGGMSVTLELSVADLVNNLSDNSPNPAFIKSLREAKEESKGSNETFLDEFLAAANKNDAPLGRIFGGSETAGDDFSRKDSNKKVVEKLRELAEEAVKNTEDIIKTRIDKFGVAQPNMTKQTSTGRIMIELPGVKNKERVRKQLQATANLEFWQTYTFDGTDENLFPYFQQLNDIISDDLYPGAREEYLASQGQAPEEKEEIPMPKIERIDTVAVYDSIEIDLADTATYAIDTNMVDDSAKYLQLVAEAEAADTSSAPLIDNDQISDDLAKKINPLFSRLGINQNGNGVMVGKAQVGRANIKDTAAINAYFRTYGADLFPAELRMMWAAKPETDKSGNPTEIIVLYALKADEEGRPAMTGEAIDQAKQDFKQKGVGVIVNMFFTDAGTAQWADVTRKAYAGGKKNIVAITLDGHVYTAPTVNQVMEQGSAYIEGNFSIEEGKDLATLLNAGSLPAKLKIVEESVVGPSLGKENIRSGLISFVVALLVVLLYMIFYYGKAGAVADVALIANIFFLVGTLASLGAALTLSGIAGIVLTIGMSVDANVLIFERIREEVRSGKGMKLAVKDGYSKAYAAIVDANLTTLLTAIVLSVFGSGPIQGFATTLIIGIFTSLFSAIFITRLIFTWMMDKKKNITFSTGVTANAFTKVNIGWLAKRKLYYVVSGLIIAGGIASLATTGLDYGVEFEGGNMYVVQMSDQADLEGMKKSLKTQFDSEPEVKQKGDSYTAQIVTKYMANSSEDNVQEQILAKLDAGMTEMGYKSFPSVAAMNESDEKGYTVIESRQVDEQISGELMIESLLAIFFSLIVIFLYILFRFKKWQFGLGALLAMAHDVLVVLGLFSILYQVMPFTMEINQAFIAAILTVVGYSINDTVVVFDRIREYLGLYKRKSSQEVVDSALNSTLSRTINTSLSTFIVLLIIFLFGGEAIRGFVFALMIGVIVGTYSSLCIATPTAFDLSRRRLTLGDEEKKA